MIGALIIETGHEKFVWLRLVRFCSDSQRENLMVDKM
jgi:hypothetical protein